SLAAFYSHSQNAMRNEFDIFKSNQDWFKSNILGATLSIPIFSSGGRLSKIQQASLELKKTSNNKIFVGESLTLGVIQAKADYATSLSKYQNEKSNMGLSKRIFDRTQIKFNEGLSSSMDLTQAHNQYLSSQTSYFNTIFELLAAKNKLDKAINNYK
ncbi:MAG: TolC family protein, partial [Flavobacterium sp.]|nr:TolC family protein [Flavobacterium sp.]